ncbi:MAG TPA: 16S rRNA (cytidine(1402)-2'-O)-methyltransferase [Candidatus Eremiobacteraceae bacterium]|nr:16S rRNA (cytidine(1402)-2'-O)-methyltransferase [Candidatus Eremiobacteraceae bacterium]
MAGRLVLCPTPLGNLEDITLRVLRTLRECDVIFAEDTRVSAVLLRAHNIDKPVQSFHERVAARRIDALRTLLAAGKTVAMVSDAGMPGISDPGIEMIRAARAAGAAIEVLPGPSAVPSAVVLSGFDASRFRFDGFPPRKPGPRAAYLAGLVREPACTVLYEAPVRMRALLDDIERELGDRRIFVLREYTKKFEQQVLGSAAEARAAISWPARGEFTVVIEGAPNDAPSAEISPAIRSAVRALLAGGASVSAVARALHGITSVSKRALYELAQEEADRE